MNISSFESFRKEINQIREYIKHIRYVNNIANYTFMETDNQQLKEILNTLKDHHRTFGIDKRIFEYKAAIISLYGLLERFIEVWIKEYLDAISNIISEYTQIDEKIREQHFELSIRLITTLISRENAKYQHLTKEDVLRKLNECIVNPLAYKINTEAFVLLSGNLKHNKIVELFNKLSIDLNNGLKTNQTLIDYFKDEQISENIANLKTDSLYNRINELVDRRNEIAHGSEAVDNILGYSVFEEYIQFLEKYCQAIFEILSEEIIKQESVHKFQKIEKVIRVINNHILAFEIEKYEIKIGDKIIVKTAEGRFFKKTILEIQKDNIRYDHIIIDEKTKIAVSVDPKIKKNQEFFYKK